MYSAKSTVSSQFLGFSSLSNVYTFRIPNSLDVLYSATSNLNQPWLRLDQPWSRLDQPWSTSRLDQPSSRSWLDLSWSRSWLDQSRSWSGQSRSWLDQPWSSPWLDQPRSSPWLDQPRLSPWLDQPNFMVRPAKVKVVLTLNWSYFRNHIALMCKYWSSSKCS